MKRRWLNVVVAAPPLVRAPQDLRGLTVLADLIELRLDLLAVPAPGDVAAWVAQSPRPVMATVRSAAQGGAFAGTPREAAALLTAAAEAGAAWLDVEAPVASHLGGLGTARVLYSTHDGAPSGSCEPEAVQKIARRIDDAQAWADWIHEVRAATTRTTWVPYGALGCTRSMFAGWQDTTFLFGAAGPDHAVVPGQPTLESLLDELRAGEVTPEATLFGLVGTPPAWSPSPALHNAVFRSQQRDALYVPLPGMGLDAACALPVGGLSVTNPYKRSAFERATIHSPEAAATGVVNTLIPTEAGWAGHNTDVLAIEALAGSAPAGATALVYGSGATARSALHALGKHGYEARLVARDATRGRATASAFGCEYIGEADARRPSDRVLVNATPAGASTPLPAFLEAFPLQGLHVIDAPYRTDADTDLVRVALAQGAACSDGGQFLLAQAQEQARLFAGDAPAPTSVMGLALAPPAPLLLLGARGVGKSTVGSRVAQQLGRPFVDLDAEVERMTGRPPAAWIRDEGWERFRAVESDALGRVLARQGVVVATGGGVVDHEPNHQAFSQARVVWLDAPPETVIERRRASRDDRPSWPGTRDLADEVRQLDRRRRDAYDRWSHVRVDGAVGLDAVVDAVCEAWPDVREMNKL